MTTINDVSDLARILRDQPQWADVIRGILLGDELLSLPEENARFVRATNDNFQMVHQRLEHLESDAAELKSGQTRLESRQDTMAGHLGNLTGSDYERRVERVAHRRVESRMNVTSPEILLSSSSPNGNPVRRLMDEAIASGKTSQDEAVELELADLVLRGTAPGGGTAYVVIETSVTIGETDIVRARARADILAGAAGETTLAAVIGAAISPENARLAESLEVVFLEVPDQHSPQG